MRTWDSGQAICGSFNPGRPTTSFVHIIGFQTAGSGQGQLLCWFCCGCVGVCWFFFCPCFGSTVNVPSERVGIFRFKPHAEILMMYIGFRVLRLCSTPCLFFNLLSVEDCPMLPSKHLLLVKAL